LQIAGRPIIQQAQAEYVRLGIRDVDARAERIAQPDEHAELELVVQAFAWTEDGRSCAALKDLAHGSWKLLAGHDD
jgi:hypothetical protein